MGFFAAIAAGFAAWTAARAALPPEAAMPVAATALLILAAAFAAIAWRSRMDADTVTYRDVAGALTLIGLCAAATIDADQMMRLVEMRGGSDAD